MRFVMHFLWKKYIFIYLYTSTYLWDNRLIQRKEVLPYLAMEAKQSSHTRKNSVPLIVQTLCDTCWFIFSSRIDGLLNSDPQPASGESTIDNQLILAWFF